MPDPTIHRVTCDAELQLNTGRVYRAVLIRPGEWAGHKIRCPAEVLQAAADKFNGLASFLNPPACQPGQHGHPMLERLLGITENAHWDDTLPPAGGREAGGIVAGYRLAGTDVAAAFRRLVDGWLRAKAAGQPVPQIGLSAVPWVRLGPPDEHGIREVRDIVSVDQVDAVYRPPPSKGLVGAVGGRGASGSRPYLAVLQTIVYSRLPINSFRCTGGRLVLHDPIRFIARICLPCPIHKSKRNGFRRKPRLTNPTCASPISATSS